MAYITFDFAELLMEYIEEVRSIHLSTWCTRYLPCRGRPQPAGVLRAAACMEGDHQQNLCPESDGVVHGLTCLWCVYEAGL